MSRWGSEADGNHGNSDGGDHVGSSAGSSAGSPGGAQGNHSRHTSFSCISSWTFYVENNEILLTSSALADLQLKLKQELLWSLLSKPPATTTPSPLTFHHLSLPCLLC